MSLFANTSSFVSFFMLLWKLTCKASGALNFVKLPHFADIKTTRPSGCLRNFDLVTSKCFFMWCSVIFSAPLLSLEQRLVKSNMLLEIKVEKQIVHRMGNKPWMRGKCNIKAKRGASFSLTAVMGLWISCPQGGADETEAIIFLHHDRWGGGGVCEVGWGLPVGKRD